MSQPVSRRHLLRAMVCGGLAVGAAGAVGYEAWRLLHRRSMDELMTDWQARQQRNPRGFALA